MTESPNDIIRVRCLLCSQILECNRDDTAALVDHIRRAHSEVTLQLSDESEDVAASSPDTLIKIPSQRESNGKLTTDNGNQPSHKNDRKYGSSISKERLAEEKKPPRRLENEIHCKSQTADRKHETQPNRKSHLQSNAPEDTPHGPKSIARKSPVTKLKTKSVGGEFKEAQVLYKRKYKYKKPLSYRRAGKRKLYKTSIEKWRPGKSTIVCPECGANKRPMIKSQTDKVSHSSIGAAFILTCWPFCFLPCLFPPPTKECLHCAVCNNFLGIYDRKTEAINPNHNSLRRSGGGGVSSTSNVVSIKTKNNG